MVLIDLVLELEVREQVEHVRTPGGFQEVDDPPRL